MFLSVNQMAWPAAALPSLSIYVMPLAVSRTTPIDSRIDFFNTIPQDDFSLEFSSLPSIIGIIRNRFIFGNRK